MRRRFVLLAGAVGLGLVSRLAAAHAHLQGASPAVGSTIAVLPEKLVCTFTEALEPLLCRIEVRGPSGTRVDRTDLALAGDPRRIAVSLRPDGAGVYRVAWVAVSVDTHRTEGLFSFTVAG